MLHSTVSLLLLFDFVVFERREKEDCASTVSQEICKGGSTTTFEIFGENEND